VCFDAPKHGNNIPEVNKIVRRVYDSIFRLSRMSEQPRPMKVSRLQSSQALIQGSHRISSLGMLADKGDTMAE
jgi:hypothetical protein